MLSQKSYEDKNHDDDQQDVDETPAPVAMRTKITQQPKDQKDNDYQFEHGTSPLLPDFIISLARRPPRLIHTHISRGKDECVIWKLLSGLQESQEYQDQDDDQQDVDETPTQVDAPAKVAQQPKDQQDDDD